MTTPPFAPRRSDGRALHRVGYEYISGLMQRGELAPGEIIPHERLASEMQAAYPSSTYFQAVSRVSRLLQRNDHRSLISVRGTGYQLIQGTGMLDQGRGQHGKARRQMSRALVTVQSVDEGHIPSAEGRVSLTMVRRGFAIITGVLSQQAEAIAAHDAEIALLRDARETDDARLSALESQLRRLRGENAS